MEQHKIHAENRSTSEPKAKAAFLETHRPNFSCGHLQGLHYPPVFGVPPRGGHRGWSDPAPGRHGGAQARRAEAEPALSVAAARLPLLLRPGPAERRDGARHGAAAAGLELLQAEEIPAVRRALLAAAGGGARRAGSGAGRGGRAGGAEGLGRAGLGWGFLGGAPRCARGCCWRDPLRAPISGPGPGRGGTELPCPYPCPAPARRVRGAPPGQQRGAGAARPPWTLGAAEGGKAKALISPVCGCCCWFYTDVRCHGDWNPFTSAWLPALPQNSPLC